MTIFEYLSRDAEYAATFHGAMGNYSAAEVSAIRQHLRGKLDGPLVFCDVGGGQGHLIAELLKDRPNAFGIVFDLPHVAAEQKKSEIVTCTARAICS
jgi:hypothetical protein